MANGFTKTVFRSLQTISTMAVGHKGFNLTPLAMTVGALIGVGVYPEMSTGATILGYLASGVTLGGVVGAMGNLSIKKAEEEPDITPRMESDWKHYKAEMLHETSRDIGKRKSVSKI
jgi:hypothetical protein